MEWSEPHVQLSLLGPFELTVAGEHQVSLSARKSQALLCYLALQSDRTISREKLATLLWPKATEEFARTNLRQSLAVVRKTLQHKKCACVLNSGDSITLDSDDFKTDTQKFSDYLTVGTTDSLEKAITLYRGELVEGIGLDDSPFGEWLLFERRHWHGMLSQVFHKLASIYADNNDTEKLFTLASRFVSFDPLDELAHRSLMQCHLKSNRRHLAIRQFETCKKLLDSELDTAPDQATLELYNNIINQTSPEPGIDNKLDARLSGPAISHDNSVVAGSRLSAERQLPWLWIFTLLAFMAIIFAVLIDPKIPAVSTPSIESRLDNVLATDSVNKPTIAVLPLINLSDDVNQDYFSDGLTEDIITELSKVNGLTVIARASSFMYRSELPDISKIANALDASVVLHGTVRRLKGRVRINVELIDARDGTQLWADRFDRELSDVLIVQDEISKTIANELSIKLTESEQQRLDRILEVNPDAYDLFLKSLRPIRELSRTGSAEAREILHRVTELDSDYTRAWANLALTYVQDLNFGFADDREIWIELGYKYAGKAAQIDDSLPQLQFTLSALHLAARNYEDALAAALRSIELEPNYADGYGALSQILVFAGELDSANKALEQAKRLNPEFTFTYLWLEGQIHFLSNNFEKAGEIFKEINDRNPSFVPGRLMLISIYGQRHLMDEADWEIAEILTIRPDFNIAEEQEVVPYKLVEHRDLYIEGLRKAGLR